ncbi:MAG: SDR family oxidoreductase [Draconibacterium sp.]|nr:SDR family oxidoreductase [Draconibacterium sp.]
MIMKKIMILGSAGMLGHMVYNYLKSLNKYIIVDTSFPEKLHGGSKLLNVTNKEELEDFISSEKPDILVNCIGILLRGSKDDPSNAIYLNSCLPHQLSKLLRQNGGKLIHISTDCVFTGNKGKYAETDFKDARDTYGLSKALGEVDNDHDLTMRTSIIGPELKEKGEGLFHWFMKQNGEINGYTKMFWGGVTTLELAKAIDAAIVQEITGLIHVTNSQPISKFEMVTLFKDIWKTDHIQITPVEGKVADKSLISVRNDFKYQVASYSKMIEDQRNWMLTYSNIYVKNYPELR